MISGSARATTYLMPNALYILGSDSILVQRGYSSPVHFGFNNIRAMTPGATKLFEFGLRPTGPDLDTVPGTRGGV